MKPIRLPRPEDIAPGTRWNIGPGLLLSVHEGKHPGGDLRLDIEGHGSPTHYGVAILLLALMQSEERYRRTGTGRGAEYFISHLGTWVHWFRAFATPKGRFIKKVEWVEGETHEMPGGWV